MLSAVGGAIDSPLFVGAENLAQRCYVNQIGISRMYSDAVYLSGMGKSDVGPGLAAIGGFVDSDAWRDISAWSS